MGIGDAFFYFSRSSNIKLWSLVLLRLTAIIITCEREVVEASFYSYSLCDGGNKCTSTGRINFFGCYAPPLFSNNNLKSVDDDDHDRKDNNKIDNELFTDELILLAMRSYLVRKHRLPWTAKMKRRQDLSYYTRTYLSTSSSQQPSITSSSSNSDIGYFWHDPTQLKYLQQPNTDEEQQQQQQQQQQQDYFITGSGNSSTICSNDVNVRASLFTSFASSPDGTFVRRSNSVKNTWSDEEFRKKWWAKRWGDRAGLAGKTNDRRINDKLQRIPPEILQSFEFKSALLEIVGKEEELSTIIKSYILSNEKRAVAARKNNNNVSNETPTTTTNSSNMEYYTSNYITNDLLLKVGKEKFLYETSEEGQRETQRKRSEKARLAYQTRLARTKQEQRESLVDLTSKQGNMNSIMDPSLSSSSFSGDLYYQVRGNINGGNLDTESNKQIFAQTSNGQTWLYTRIKQSEKNTYQQAMNNIREAIFLNNNNVKASDIKLLLEPKRLSGRKELLISLIKKRFGLIGKCVPTSTIEENQKSFVTHATITQLGDFVLHLVDKEEQQLQLQLHYISK